MYCTMIAMDVHCQEHFIASTVNESDMRFKPPATCSAAVQLWFWVTSHSKVKSFVHFIDFRTTLVAWYVLEIYICTFEQASPSSFESAKSIFTDNLRSTYSVNEGPDIMQALIHHCQQKASLTNVGVGKSYPLNNERDFNVLNCLVCVGNKRFIMSL